MIRLLTIVIACLLTAPAARSFGAQGTLIVLNKSEATASILDLDTGREVAELPTGAGPHEVAISASGATAVVANYGGQEPGNTLTVLDVDQLRVASTIDLPMLRRPHGIVFLPDGRILVTCEQEQAVAIVNIESRMVEKIIGTEARVSHMVVATPNGRRAFVANIGDGSVTALDLAMGSILKQIPTAPGAEGIDITPDGAQVWVANRAANNLTIIDAATLEVLDTIDCGGEFPIRLKITPDGKRALVSNARSGEVAVLDTATRTVERTIRMDAEAVDDGEGRLFGAQFGASPAPIGILIRPDGKRAYIANTNADIVTEIDLETWQIVGRLKAGRQPDGLGWSPLKPRDGAMEQVGS
ncbi:MAG: beta-propeller fold lactonase family protein [Phycisphaerales bacterium JB039]